MSVCLTKTEIIGGSVDGTVRTFDIRIGRYVTQKEKIHGTHFSVIIGLPYKDAIYRK